VATTSGDSAKWLEKSGPFSVCQTENFRTVNSGGVVTCDYFCQNRRFWKKVCLVPQPVPLPPREEVGPEDPKMILCRTCCDVLRPFSNCGSLVEGKNGGNVGRVLIQISAQNGWAIIFVQRRLRVSRAMIPPWAEGPVRMKNALADGLTTNRF